MNFENMNTIPQQSPMEKGNEAMIERSHLEEATKENLVKRDELKEKRKEMQAEINSTSDDKRREELRAEVRNLDLEDSTLNAEIIEAQGLGVNLTKLRAEIQTEAGAEKKEGDSEKILQIKNDIKSYDELSLEREAARAKLETMPAGDEKTKLVAEVMEIEHKRNALSRNISAARDSGVNINQLREEIKLEGGSFRSAA